MWLQALLAVVLAAGITGYLRREAQWRRFPVRKGTTVPVLKLPVKKGSISVECLPRECPSRIVADRAGLPSS